MTRTIWPEAELLGIARSFDLPGTPRGVRPLGSGHINDTFRVVSGRGPRTFSHILQRINTNVFANPEAVMANIARVTEHVRASLVAEGRTDAARRCLSLVPSRDGKAFFRDATGGVWRVYEEIRGALSVDRVENLGQAREAARAFSGFSRRLSDLPVSALSETIPAFHDTRSRFAAFLAALQQDPVGRARETASEIEAFAKREPLAACLEDPLARGLIERQAAHNDTKVNNILFDATSGEALAVVDLDTVMPGLFLHDFGDLVRSAANSAREDETEPSKAVLSEPVFSALVEGTLEGLGRPLRDAERGLLVSSAMVLTFELGLRFLTDYLLGDTYFRTNRQGQNLDRARVHLSLLMSMEDRRDALEAAVEKASVDALAFDVSGERRGR
ncbi:MAG: aminoglycoside phosphotransferase family protein [Thermoanaerobaculia bacterium]|nr:aminoglycoside phosphotransferase family protein [Thermoanaerobaculia bacterium]